MAEALLKGILSKCVTTADQVNVSEPLNERRNFLTDRYNVRTINNNIEVCRLSDLVMLAVKPQIVTGVLETLQGSGECSKCIFVSIVAGLTISTLEEYLGTGTRIVRSVPNTPMLINSGACAYALNAACQPEDAATVATLFEACGICEQVPNEKLLDALVGLSGSGPAYIYILIEALSDGGVRQGLPRALATRFAAQTVLGASKMVLETGQHPGQLKDAVTSPGGTTIAGIHALEAGAFRGCVINAVEAATRRGEELGRR